MKIQDPTLRKLAAKLARPKPVRRETRELAPGTKVKGAKTGVIWECAEGCEVERVGSKGDRWRFVSGNVIYTTRDGINRELVSARGIRIRM